MAGGTFENNQFDPVLIVAQIGCMQCLFYAVLCPAMLCARAVAAGRILVQSFSLADVFVPARVVAGGVFPALCAHALAAVVCAAGLVPVVGKARRCWDYAATICINHAVAVLCAAHGSVGVAAWWLVLAGTGVLCTLLGERLCMHYEMRAIPLRVSATQQHLV